MSHKGKVQLTIIFTATPDLVEQGDQVFEQLEKAYQEHEAGLPGIGGHPAYDNLRSDPRFHDLLRRMNLEP